MKHILTSLFCLVALLSHGQNDNSSIQSQITNYKELDQVLKLEKLEIGIKLPQSIEHKVSNFVSDLPLNKINPFLEWELKVTAEFIHEDLDSSIFVDGYFALKYESYMTEEFPMPANRKSYSNDEYKSLGGYTKVPSDYKFYVRFAPALTGKWKYRIISQTPGRSIESEFNSFEVIESDNKGFLKVGENNRFLKLGDSSFYPIGGNAPWPATSPIQDPEFAKLSNYKGTPYSENYRTTYCLPRVYEKYKDALTSMADGGSNSFRMLMYPSSTGLEWEELGNYTARLHMAQELDEIVDLAKEKNLIIDWNTQIHYSFQQSSKAYNTRWAWDSKINGKSFCYQDLIKSDHPIDFFKDEKSKKYYKQKLRYILARWGYSTNIGVFELMSEINNIAETSFNYDDDRRKEIDVTLTKWLVEMGDYMKSHHNGRIHLLTSSYAGLKTNQNNIFLEESMDIMSANIYDFQTPSFGKFWVKFISKKILNDKNPDAYTVQSGNLKNRNIKPLIYSETGVLEANRICDFDPIEMERLLWQSLFSGVAAAYDWEYWSRKDLTSNGKASNVIREYQLDKDQWHPGAMKSVRTKSEPSWVYTSSFAKRMEGVNHKADLTYLRSGNRNEAVGVITNMTYNIYSVSDCADEFFQKKNIELNWPLIIDTPEKIKTSGRKSENLKVKHLKSGKYTVEYFLLSDLKTPIKTTTEYGPTIKIDYLLGDDLESYIILFKIKKL